MTHTRTINRTAGVFALVCALALALVANPGSAYAGETTSGPSEITQALIPAIFQEIAGDEANEEGSRYSEKLEAMFADAVDTAVQAATGQAGTVNKLLTYDPAAIAAIGSQAQSGHSICCPSYSCAYADAVLDGTVHDHSYYTCSNCTWTDWGGGGSWNRNAGSDEQLLREAYDQITAGRPVVTHVSWSGGEHWIALIGYENATDPDHLTLANFIALDPWDGAQINAASKYALYGDGCQHISAR